MGRAVQEVVARSTKTLTGRPVWVESGGTGDQSGLANDIKLSYFQTGLWKGMWCEDAEQQVWDAF